MVGCKELRSEKETAEKYSRVPSDLPVIGTKSDHSVRSFTDVRRPFSALVTRRCSSLESIHFSISEAGNSGR
jgi:hypothetical protein